MSVPGLVRAEMRGAVRVIWLQAPPGNLFGPELCAALMSGLQDAMADTQTKAVVLTSGLQGAGRGFSAGIDLADLGRDWPKHSPTPGDIVRLVLEADLPVIAALHGPVLGQGQKSRWPRGGGWRHPTCALACGMCLLGGCPWLGQRRPCRG